MTDLHQPVGRTARLVLAIPTGLGGLLSLGLGCIGVARLLLTEANATFLVFSVVCVVLGGWLLRAAWRLGSGRERADTGGLFSPTVLLLSGVGFIAMSLAAPFIGLGWETAVSTFPAGLAACVLAAHRRAGSREPARIDRAAVAARAAAGATAEELVEEFGCSSMYAEMALRGELPQDEAPEIGGLEKAAQDGNTFARRPTTRA